MSDPDRGGNRSQGERPLSFDARQPVRGERAVPVAFLISAGILLVLIVAVVVAYRGGVRGADEAPSAVGSAVGDIKTAAPADAQPVDPAAGLQIYNDEKGAPSTPVSGDPGFAPPPEQPQPRPAAAAPATTAPAPATSAAPITTPAPTAVQPSGPVAARPLNSPAPASAAPAAPVAKAAPPPTPRPAAPAPAAAAPAAAAPARAAASVSAQVGAFSSSALADRGWADAVRLAPGAAVGKGKAVEEAQVNGRTVYRALVTGFENRAAAVSFCASVSAAGGNCLVR